MNRVDRFAWVLFLGLLGCEEDLVAVARPEICARPESVDFGAQIIRTVSTRAVAVTNCGGFLIDRISARLVDAETGAIMDEPLSITATEVPVPLGVSDFFRLGLRYRPEAAEEHNAVLELSLDEFETPLEIVRVPVGGRGVLPEACAPSLAASLTFPLTEVGQTREEAVTFTNNGSGTCALSGARVLDGAAHFSLVDAAPIEVAAGASAMLAVRYAPRDAGQHLGNLAVIAGGVEQLTADLIGEARRSESCALLAIPSPVVFPRAILSTLDTTATFTVESSGELDCAIAAAEISTGADVFTLTAGLAPGDVLPSGTSTSVTVTFSPDATGARTGNLRVTAQSGATLDVPLSAFADPRPSCALRFQPSPLTFAPIAVGLEEEGDITLTNLSSLECTITAVRLPAGELALVGPDATGPLAAGASRTARVRYTPQIAAPTISELEVELDGRDVQTVEVVGFADFADLRLTPGLQHMGIITEGCASAPKTITLTNVGPVAARVDRVGLSATTDPNFELLGAVTTPFVLGPMESRAIAIRMLGTTHYSGQSAELEVTATGTLEPLVRARVRGQSESLAEASRRDVFIQAEQSAVDILFVIDNSGSMSAEQTSLRQNFQTYIEFFTSELVIDYHLGITTTDTSASGERGALVGPYISNATPNPVAEFNLQADVGINGSADERGLLASVQAVTSPNTDLGGPNAGFLRDDALLSVVYVTDEDDRSSGTVDSYLDQLLAAKGYRSELVLTSAIAGDVPGGCASAVAGFRYYDIVQATQLGIFESICTPDWALTMEQLGFSTFAALTRFKLGRTPGPATITVVVDGVTIPNDPQNGWTYDPMTNAIVFHGTSVPAAGAEIVAEYTSECLPI